MITGNVLTEIGDVLIVDTQLSVLGSYIKLELYADSVIGETATRYFNRKFRVSCDGLLYTEWEDLTNTNISLIEGNIVNNIIYIQYRYERAGSDNTGDLEFVSIDIIGNVTPSACTSPVVDNSIFKGLSCGNFITMQLCSNLLKKLYKSGIVPEYITRGVPVEDEDYIAFWSAVATYMAMFVTFLMRFNSLYMDRELLIKYLQQMNVHFTENETSLEDLQYISSHYLSEINKRGTKIPFMRKSEILQDETYPQIDGEILRILGINECDEFLWTLKPSEQIGWNMGNSSPMYKGTSFDKNLIKGFEKSDIIDLSNYLTFGDVSLSPSDMPVFELVSHIGTKTGIGFEDFYNETTVKDYGVVVDPELDYEMTFLIKKNIDDPSISGTINFRCHAFDCYDNKYKLLRIDDEVESDTFIDGLQIYVSNQYYFVRGIIFSKQHRKITTNGKFLNTSNGINLKFSDQPITKIMPYLEVNSSTEGVLFNLQDFKIRPLRYSHSCGFLNTFNVIEIFAKNQNTKLTYSQIYDVIRRDLIPYNSVLSWNDKL
jgi:hypothetical protein